MSADQPIRYSDDQTMVQIGDRVRVRMFLFLKRMGRVVYVPGCSQLHQEMEHDGIRLVGINFDGGGSGGFWVEPSTSILIKTVTFVNRDGSPTAGLPSEESWK